MAQLPPGADPSKVPWLPPPAGQSSNFVDPPSLASIAEGVGGLLIAVETLLVTLRTASNLKTFRKLRLEDYKLFRYKLYAAFAFIAVTTLPSVPMYLAICLPHRNGSWETASMNCRKTAVWSYVQGPTSVIFDLFALYLPASVIVHLHMPLHRKLGILTIFMTGTLALIASIIGLVYRIRLVHHNDDTWASFIVVICFLIEPCVSIICCCMPAIPAISKLIVDNGTFISLRSRLRSLYALSNRSKSSDGTGVSRRKAFPGGSGRSNTKDSSNEFEPYIQLVDGDGRSSTTKTHIRHTPRAEPQTDPGIHKSVELEVSSRAKTVQSQGSGQV
ncbi:MAG: hypothetical protein Q9173_004343 [Seirophora scorigena]